MKFFIILLLAVSAISAAAPQRRTLDVKSMLTSVKSSVGGFFGDQAASFGDCLKTKGLAEGKTLAKDMMAGVAKSIAAKFGMRRLGLLDKAAGFIKGKACSAMKGPATSACATAANKAIDAAACPSDGKFAKACGSSWANVIKPCVKAEVTAVCAKLVAKACPSRRRLVSVRRTSVADMMSSMKGKVAGFFGNQAATFGSCVQTKGLAEGKTLAKEMMTGVAKSIAAKFGMRRLGLLGKVTNFVKGKACAAFKGAATTACNKAAKLALSKATCPTGGKLTKACTSSWANVIKPCVEAEVPAVCDKLVAAACPSRRRLVSVRRTSVADMMKNMKSKVSGFFGDQAATFGDCLKTKGLAEGKTLAKDMMTGVAKSIAAKFGMRRLGLLGKVADLAKSKACNLLSTPAKAACAKAANAAIDAAACPSDGKFAKACTSSWANVIKPCVKAEVTGVCAKLVAKAC